MREKVKEVALHGAWFALYSAVYFAAMVASAGLGVLKGWAKSNA